MTTVHIRAGLMLAALIAAASAIALNASTWGGLLAFVALALAVVALHTRPPDTRSIAERRFADLNKTGWMLIWLVALLLIVVSLA